MAVDFGTAQLAFARTCLIFWTLRFDSQGLPISENTVSAGEARRMGSGGTRVGGGHHWTLLEAAEEMAPFLSACPFCSQSGLPLRASQESQPLSTQRPPPTALVSPTPCLGGQCWESRGH